MLLQETSCCFGVLMAAVLGLLSPTLTLAPNECCSVCASLTFIEQYGTDACNRCMCMCRLTVSQPQQEAAVNSLPFAKPAQQVGEAARAAPQPAQEPNVSQAAANKQPAAQASPLPAWLKSAAATAAQQQQRRRAAAAGSTRSVGDQTNSGKGSNSPAQDPIGPAHRGQRWAAVGAPVEPESSLASHTPLPAVEPAAARQPMPVAAAGVVTTRAAEPAAVVTAAAALLPGSADICIQPQFGRCEHQWRDRAVVADLRD